MLRSAQVFAWFIAYRDKEVVEGVFIDFRAPLHFIESDLPVTSVDFVCNSSSKICFHILEFSILQLLVLFQSFSLVLHPSILISGHISFYSIYNKRIKVYPAKQIQ
jgi:hypothetical protein